MKADRFLQLYSKMKLFPVEIVENIRLKLTRHQPLICKVKLQGKLQLMSEDKIIMQSEKVDISRHRRVPCSIGLRHGMSL